MNLLELYLQKLDASDQDESNRYDIIREFGNIITELEKLNDSNSILLAKFEYENLYFPKNIGSGVLHNRDSLTQEQINYYSKRFDDTKNLFLKSEYGIILYINSIDKTFKKDNWVLNFTEVLFKLVQQYYLKMLQIGDDKYYNQYFIGALDDLLLILRGRAKNKNDFESIQFAVLDFFYMRIITADTKNAKENFLVFHSVDFIKKDLTKYKAKFDLSIILTKINDAYDFNKDINYHFAIDFAKKGEELCVILGVDKLNWKIKQAESYEKLAKEAEIKKNSVEISFIEDALKLYKEIKDEKNVKRLSDLYLKKRAGIGITKFSHDIPQAEVDRTQETLDTMLEKYFDEDLIRILGIFPFIEKLSIIKKEAKEMEKNSLMLNIVVTEIKDKSGNTIEFFNPSEPAQKERLALLNTYYIYSQFAFKKLEYFFFNGIKSGKITRNNLFKTLETSWLGTSFVKKYVQDTFEIKPLNNLIPGINLIWSELEKCVHEEGYIPNLICGIDSLGIKIEYLLRIFCEKLSIPTFYVAQGDGKVKMEKSINSLLDDEQLSQNISEDDLFFMKFILIEKIGKNLRNKISHGLMDDFEYTSIDAILLIVILIKLSFYKFIEIENV
ncbi:MAG: DUF4209 domain-containing protein [Bacteroidetes bacterium]|nr:DUF4209 domain-containing protein [Bacteroidota bacterium]